MRYTLLFLILATVLAGAEATGRWTGKLIVNSPDGEQSHAAMVVFKQDGTSLTGTAGPDDDQTPIQNGKVDGSTITFDIARDGIVMHFNLKQNEDEIAGEVTREREGQKQTARLILKREKQ